MIAALHPWWPVLWHWPRFLDPISWLWLSARGYAFTSSGEQIEIPVALLVLWRQHMMCDAPWCLRPGPHRTADGHHKLCRKHHPDLPNRKLSLAEIHLRHHAASAESSKTAG